MTVTRDDTKQISVIFIVGVAQNNANDEHDKLALLKLVFINAP